MGWGQGIGIGWPNASSGYTYGKDLVTRFRRRVISAGGIFREAICLQLKLDALDSINLLRNVSLMITPNAFNTGVIYDVLPNTPLGDMDFERNSLAMRVANNQLLETNSAQSPRLDFTGNTCPTWLVEPQRTNLCLYSKTFTKKNTWVKFGSAVAVASDVGTAPNGATQAALLSLGDFNSGIDQFIYYPFDENSSVTISLYVKSQENGVISFGPNTPPGHNLEYIIEDFGFGWYRHIITRNLTSPGGVIQFTIGNLKDDFIIWGAQLEIGAYATSHIQTTSSTQTRGADTINKDGIGDLIGQTEGTLFCDVNLDIRSNGTYLALAGDINNIFKDCLSIAFTRDDIIFLIRKDSHLQGNIIYPNNSTGRFKIAAAYIENNCNLYVNGVNIGSVLSCSIPVTSGINLTGNPDGKPINPMRYNSVQVYKTKLSEAELIDLTTI
jgi:hypothetical protein